MCEKCGKEVSKSNIARHRRACAARKAREGDPGRDATRRSECRMSNKTKTVPGCGEMKSAANLARHMRNCGGVPGR